MLVRHFCFDTTIRIGLISGNYYLLICKNISRFEIFNLLRSKYPHIAVLLEGCLPNRMLSVRSMQSVCFGLHMLSLTPLHNFLLTEDMIVGSDHRFLKKRLLFSKICFFFKLG